MTVTTRPAEQIVAEVRYEARVRTDRRVGGLLLAFFLSLYLMTGGGHLYSPDGEFSYRMAHSLTVDPDHEYLWEMQRGFSQWGFMVPLLSQPLVLLGEMAANVAPQKDHAIVDGSSYKLGIFREPGLPEESPTAGPEWDYGGSTYTRTDIAHDPADTLVMISFLSLARQIPQGTVVATATVTDVSGETLTFPIRAGLETAEWSSGKGTVGIQHEIPRVASVWSGNTTGRNYYVEIPFERTIRPAEVKFQYQVNEGRFFVRSLALLDRDTGAIQTVPSDYGFWSERENRDFFTQLLFSPYNAVVSAIVIVLLFALVRLFGYSQAVAVVASLIYGLATIAWPYSKFDFSEPTLVMFILATLYLVYRWGDEARSRFLLLAGLTALASIGTKYVAAILLPAIGLQILLLHWERYPSLRGLPKIVWPLLAFAAPFLVVAAPAMLFLSQRFGYYPSIFEAWAGVQRGWLALPLSIGLRGLIFSPGRSLFLYAPVTVLALVSASPFIKRHGTRSVGLIAMAVIYFVVYGMKISWHAGAGWGPRYQLVVIPLLILVLAPLIKKAIEERHKLARYALLTVFLLGIAVQLLGVSKSFESYLGMFRSDIVKQLPEQGAPYGGADYYPYSWGQADGNSITATVWALPFSPILAHTWLLSADLLSVGPPALNGVLVPLRDSVLRMPPWRIWGIQAAPAHPEHGLGFDLWSMKLRTDFPSDQGFLVAVFVILLSLQTVLVFSGARLVHFLFRQSSRRTLAARLWLAFSVIALLLFNALHFLL